MPAKMYETPAYHAACILVNWCTFNVIKGSGHVCLLQCSCWVHFDRHGASLSALLLMYIVQKLSLIPVAQPHPNELIHVHTTYLVILNCNYMHALCILQDEYLAAGKRVIRLDWCCAAGRRRRRSSHSETEEERKLLATSSNGYSVSKLFICLHTKSVTNVNKAVNKNKTVNKMCLCCFLPVDFQRSLNHSFDYLHTLSVNCSLNLLYTLPPTGLTCIRLYSYSVVI